METYTKIFYNNIIHDTYYFNNFFEHLKQLFILYRYIAFALKNVPSNEIFLYHI